MESSGDRRIAAPVEQVWDALCDPATLRRCIPHCERFEAIPGVPDMFDARLSAHVGRMVGHFTVRVKLYRDDPPHAYRLRCEGVGGSIGSVKGGALVTLSHGEDGTTSLGYHASAGFTGALRAVPEGLVVHHFQRYAAHFFQRLDNELTGADHRPEPIELPAFGATGAPAYSRTDARAVPPSEETLPAWAEALIAHPWRTAAALAALTLVVIAALIAL